ncbi:hypothetical protein G6F57_017179 [Rhizopus arrhizus]|nr:hypothetical protein G6F57_017179 [Rhizopus arrhizus]
MLLDGNPAAELEVNVVPGGSRYRDKVGEIKLKTDKDGKFSVKWAQPGLYWIEAGMEDAKVTVPQAKKPRRPSAGTADAPRGAAAPAVRVAYGAMPVAFAAPAALAGATMGTTWSARMALPAGCSDQAARMAIQAALDEVVAQMSTWEVGSDISLFNQAGPGWRELPDAFFHVLRHAMALAQDSAGAYDPTVGPLVNAWGFGPHQRAFEPPSPAAIDAARLRCGWQRVALDTARQAAFQPGGAYLDLSSIAKGYGVDRAAMALDALGITQYLRCPCPGAAA